MNIAVFELYFSKVGADQYFSYVRRTLRYLIFNCRLIAKTTTQLLTKFSDILAELLGKYRVFGSIRFRPNSWPNIRPLFTVWFWFPDSQETG